MDELEFNGHLVTMIVDCEKGSWSMMEEFMIATGCEVACDQCRFGGERAGCHGACVQLA